MSEQHEAGVSAARRLAGWEIGDPTWADRIIDAYLNPEQAEQRLDEDDVPQVTGVWR